uniref:Uncharacterized protein n=1 Tax=Oryza rufipogon TaxID=4529 RepID=A0A0E0NEB1_ORYRU
MRGFFEKWLTLTHPPHALAAAALLPSSLSSHPLPLPLPPPSTVASPSRRSHRRPHRHRATATASTHSATAVASPFRSSSTAASRCRQAQLSLPSNGEGGHSLHQRRGTGASTPPPPLPRRRMWSGWRWGRRRGRGACSPVDPAVLEAGLVWRLLAAAGQLTRGGAVAVAVDALLFEHLWWLQHTPTSSLPSPSWVINSPSSRPLAPPDSVDVIPPLAIVGRRAATPPPLPSHAAGPCRKTSTGHNHRCPLLQQIHATGRRPQSQCDLEVEKLGCGFFANTRVNLANDMVGLDSMRVSRACALLTMAAGGPHTNSSLVVLPSWDAGSDRCSGRGDDCFFLGWEPPFANLAAADARISFPVCVPEVNGSFFLFFHRLC